MLFDWFTVAAQGVNFLILVWLLKRFLYGPIIKAIDERQQKIITSLNDAANTKLEAEEERAQFQEEREALENQRQELLKDATTSAQAEGKRLLEQAQQAAEELTRRRMESLRNQEQKLEESLRQRAQEEAISLTRQVLQELAGADLERRVVEVFLNRLRALDEAQRQALVQATLETEGNLLIRSAFEISEETRQDLEGSLREHLGQLGKVTYQVIPTLLVGLELVAEGHKIAWTGVNLLEKVESRVRQSSSEAKPS